MALKTKIARIDRPLPCELTKDERLLKGQELALSLQRLAAHHAESDATRADLKATRETIEGEIAVLRDVVASGVQTRDVSCDVWGDHDTGAVRVIRSDTGVAIEYRAMTPAERQLPIDLVSPEDPPPAGLD